KKSLRQLNVTLSPQTWERRRTFRLTHPAQVMPSMQLRRNRDVRCSRFGDLIIQISSEQRPQPPVLPEADNKKSALRKSRRPRQGHSHWNTLLGALLVIRSSVSLAQPTRDLEFKILHHRPPSTCCIRPARPV